MGDVWLYGLHQTGQWQSNNVKKDWKNRTLNTDLDDYRIKERTRKRKLRRTELQQIQIQQFNDEKYVPCTIIISIISIMF